jgi:transposase-like protein
MPIKPEHLDELLAGYEKPEDLLGEDGLFKQLKKALLERALGAELTHHLGYEKGDPGGRGTGNNRNGTYGKTVLTEDGAVEIDVPRDRNGSFEPQIVAKGETRLDGFDDKIISLYARGMTVREIQGHLRELYAVDVSPDLISRVTDAVLDEVREWQNRPLDTVYPVVFFDALRVKIRDEGCAYQKLNPTILMMKSAEDRPNNELAKALDWPTARRILVQRQVRSAFVVIAGVGRSDPP